MDQLHDEHGLTDASSAEHRSLGRLGKRREKVDYLDACLNTALVEVSSSSAGGGL